MSHKDFLFKLLDLFDKNDIPYFFLCGTLLGAVREKDFLPNDEKDTDIAIDEAYYWEVRRLFDKEIIENQELRYVGIRRKEITVAIKDFPYKLDIFFMEKINEDYYIYSYKKPKDKPYWFLEWRAKFPYELFFPLKQITFLGRKINVPQEYKKVLEIHYGKDWQIPNPKFDTYSQTNIDQDYKGFYPAGILGTDYIANNKEYEIGFICINFFRKDSTKECIESIKKNHPNIKVYVADQDAPSGEMIEFYEKNNIEYYYLPFDCGLSYCRNFLVDKVKEPYLMWGDNDFVFSEDNKINHALTLLQKLNDVGFVGGSIKNTKGITLHYERLLKLLNNYGILLYIPLELTHPQTQSIEGIDFYYCDLTFNFVVCKTKILLNNQKLRWNVDLKVSYEHTDMFLRIKEYSKYRVAYCPSMTVIHNHTFTNKNYNEYRLRKNAGEIFAKAWNLRMNFTIGEGRELYFEHMVSSKNSLANELYNNPNQSLLQENPPLVPQEMNPQLKILFSEKIEFWLLNQSCLEVIKTKRLTSNKICIGVKNEETLSRVKVLLEKYLEDTEIIVESNRATKEVMVFMHYKVNVPMPVVAYLTSTYGGNWQNG
jgi:phosphorylcholine metabolism protein LicD/GT2 family glycosyltransferase